MGNGSVSSWKEVQDELRCAAEVLHSVCAEASPISPRDAQAVAVPEQMEPVKAGDSHDDWWMELQEKHPDLARLVQSQRTELVRIGGSCADVLPSTTKHLSPRQQAIGQNFVDVHAVFH